MDILEGHNKFYVNDADGNQVAEIVFVPTGEHLSIIEHTDVDPSLKGWGNSWWQKWSRRCAVKIEKLSRYARLPNMSLIIRGNMTIFGRRNTPAMAGVFSSDLFKQQHHRNHYHHSP